MQELRRSRWTIADGYRICTVYYADGSKRTVREHREIMEAHLGRRLEPWEHVHHKDEDRSNNVLENLEVKTASSHASHHAQRPTEMTTLICKGCGVTFERKACQERHNRNQGKTGPFCGRSCSARWAILARPLQKRGRCRPQDSLGRLQCSTCKRFLDKNNFGKSNKQASGRASSCRACRAAKARAYRRKRSLI